jgi:hypothetical protein
MAEEGAIPGGERTLSGVATDLTEVFAAGDTAPLDAASGQTGGANVPLDGASPAVVVETDAGETVEFFTHDPAPIAWIDPLATLGHDFITHSDWPQSVVLADSGASLLNPISGPALVNADESGHTVASTQGAPLTGNGLEVDKMLDSDDPLAFVAGVTSASAALDSPAPPSASIAAVPEPAALLLLVTGLGLRSMMSARRRSGRVTRR